MGALDPANSSVALVGDNNFGNIYRFPLNAGRTGFVLPSPLDDLIANNNTEANTARLGSGFGAVTDLEQAPNGDIYVVDIANGTIYRIYRPGAPQIPVFPSASD